LRVLPLSKTLAGPGRVFGRPLKKHKETKIPRYPWVQGKKIMCNFPVKIAGNYQDGKGFRGV